MAINIDGDGLIALGGTASTQGRLRLAEDTDNGTNFIELTAPASVASDRTITFPDATTTVVGTDATQTLTNKSIVATQLTGTVAAARLPAGSVLQVVTTVTTSSTSTTSGSLQDSGLALSITPTSATSKVLVLVNQHIRVNRDDAAGFGVRLVRAGTTIFTRDGGDNSGVFINAGIVGAIDFRTQPVIVFLDSPATTSATEYKTQIASFGSGTVNAQANANPSTLTLLEIAA